MFAFRAKPLETKINRLYDRFRPLATRFGYVFERPVISVDGKPNIVFLGNHSSGKSTFINYLLEGEPIQDTGVAPTDDGFTILLYGTEETDILGPAALAKLPAEFSALSSLGASFLQRLRVKVRNRPLLKQVNLIDSPGMVDAAGGAAQRDYDFMTAVRRVSEISDLVLFMFDPDKPGTTSETVEALRHSLGGMDFKLRILLNKCDTFDSMYDFARAYGSLCWNVSHVLRSKDLPTIYTTYVPLHSQRSDSRVELGDFDRHRGAVTSQIQQSSRRRIDNIVSSVSNDFARLSMHVRMICAVRRRLVARVAAQSLWALLWVAAGGLAGYIMTRLWLPVAAEAGLWNWKRLVGGAFIILLAGGVGVAVSRLCHSAYRRYRRELLSDLNTVFEEEYDEDLAPGGRDDLRQSWETMTEKVRGMLVSLDSKLPAFTWVARKRLSEAVTHTIPQILDKAHKAE